MRSLDYGRCGYLLGRSVCGAGNTKPPKQVRRVTGLEVAQVVWVGGWVDGWPETETGDRSRKNEGVYVSRESRANSGRTRNQLGDDKVIAANDKEELECWRRDGCVGNETSEGGGSRVSNVQDEPKSGSGCKLGRLDVGPERLARFEPGPCELPSHPGTIPCSDLFGVASLGRPCLWKPSGNHRPPYRISCTVCI